MIRKVWQAIPEGAVKSWIRQSVRNFQQRGSAKYRREGDSYVIETSRFRMKTVQPSYGLPVLLQRFEAHHKVGRGEIVMDAGAFEGMVTNALSQIVGPEGRVIAFEPDQSNLQRVQRNLHLNGDSPNVQLLNEGLWNSEGQTQFCERGALGSSAFWEGPGGHMTTIKTTTIDAVVSRLGLRRLDFVKMNIEGAEIKALEGASQTIQRFRPDFAICTDHALDGDIASGLGTREVVETKLREHGYVAETIMWEDEWVTYGTPAERVKH